MFLSIWALMHVSLHCSPLLRLPGPRCWRTTSQSAPPVPLRFPSTPLHAPGLSPAQGWLSGRPKTGMASGATRHPDLCIRLLGFVQEG